MKVEILFTAWNRLEFTRVAFELLKRNTDWSRVSRLVVYDDGSEDGTLEYLQRQRSRNQQEEHTFVDAFEIQEGGWHSTGATMNDFIAGTEAEAFVKIDNDIAMPPGWLPVLLDVAARNNDYELVGMEAAWTGGVLQEGVRHRDYSVTRAKHIGGVGLMREKAFRFRKPIPLSLGKNGRAGFTIWQHRYHLRAGWVTPDLPVMQLDKLPIEPFAKLSARYVEEGWARPWEPYPTDMEEWWSWIPKDVLALARVRRRRPAR